MYEQIHNNNTLGTDRPNRSLKNVITKKRNQVLDLEKRNQVLSRFGLFLVYF